MLTPRARGRLLRHHLRAHAQGQAQPPDCGRRRLSDPPHPLLGDLLHGSGPLNEHAVAHLLGKVQKALRKEPVVPFISFEHALNKLQEKGVVTADEAAKLHDYNEKRKLAVRVDEYTFDMELVPASQTLKAIDGGQNAA